MAWWTDSIRTPAAEVHDFSERLLRMLGLVIYEFTWNQSRGWGREFWMSLRIRPEMGLGLLLHQFHCVIPPADSLVFQGLHNSHTCCHYPCSPCWCWRTHIVEDGKLKLLFWKYSIVWWMLCKWDEMVLLLYKFMNGGGSPQNMGKPWAAGNGFSWGWVWFQRHHCQVSPLGYFTTYKW